MKPYNPEDTKISELIPREIFKDRTYSNIAALTYENWLREQKTPLPGRPDLTEENLIAMGKEYSWLKDVNLVLAVKKEYDLEELLGEISELISKDKVHTNGKPLISLDLETTGLDRTWRKYGGEIMLPLGIIGIGLAFMTKDLEEISIYVPTAHIKTDNQELGTALSFVQKLHDEYHIVYHNGLYDREVLQLHGVSLNKNWSDTMLMAIAVLLRRGKADTIGLKGLSDEHLGRRMLEIDEVAKNAELYRVDGDSVLTYGCSDVLNTLQLYWEFREGEDFEDPYEDQKLIMNIDTVAADYSNSMNRFNYPIHITNARKMNLMLFRRAELCLQQLDKFTNGEISNYQSTPETGMWVYHKLLKGFEMTMFDSDTSEGMKKDLIEKFHQNLVKVFKMEIKHRTLKSGKVNTSAKFDENVMDLIYFKIDEVNWIDDSVKESVKIFCDLLTTYKKCISAYTLTTKMVRYAYVDDCPITRMGAGVKFFGAISTRYANESGKGSNRVNFSVKKGATMGNFVKGNGIAGLNAQGIPSDPLKLVKTRKLTKVPTSVQEAMAPITELATQTMIDYFKEM